MATRAEYVVVIKGSAAAFERAMAGIRRGARRTANAVQRSAQAMRRALERAIPIIIRVAAAIAAVAIAAIAAGTAFTGWGLKLAAEAEQAAIAFEAMLGSATRARELLQDLEEFSVVTPFTPIEVRDAGRTLLAFGVSADEVRQRLEWIGNAAATTGTQLGEMAAVYGKALAQGKVTNEVLIQLAERSVPIYDELAANLGKTRAEITKMASEGKVSVDDLTNAFQTLSSEGGIYYEALIRQSQTLGGLWSTITGQAQILAERWGKALLPIAKEIAAELSRWLTYIGEVTGLMRDDLSPITQQIAIWVDAIGDGFIQLAIISATIYKWWNQIGIVINRVYLSVMEMMSRLPGVGERFADAAEYTMERIQEMEAAVRLSDQAIDAMTRRQMRTFQVLAGAGAVAAEAAKDAAAAAETAAKYQAPVFDSIAQIAQRGAPALFRGTRAAAEAAARVDPTLDELRKLRDEARKSRKVAEETRDETRGAREAIEAAFAEVTVADLGPT